MKFKTIVLALGIMAMSTSVFAGEAVESGVEVVESAVEVGEEVTSEETVSEGTVSEEAAADPAEEVESGVEAAEDMAEESESVAEEAEKPEKPKFNAMDYIEFGDYKGLKVEVPKVEITDDEIDEEIKYDLEYFDEAHEQIKEGEVKDGDTVNIDYMGKVDGEEFDGGTDKDYNLEIGSGIFIKGFEEGLVGTKVGDTVDLDLAFPEDYFEESLAGKPVVFTVTVNYIDKLKDFDDALAEKMSEGECKTVEEYRAKKAKELEASAREDNEYTAKNSLYEMVMDVAEINEYPQELVDYYMNEAEGYYRDYASMLDMEYDDFIKDQQVDLEEVAKETVKSDFVIDGIAELENLIPANDEEWNAAYQEIAEKYGFENVDDLFDTYSEDDIKYNVMYELVMDFLYENADITEVMESEIESDDVAVLEDADFEVVDEDAEAVSSNVAEAESVAESTAESVAESTSESVAESGAESAVG